MDNQLTTGVEKPSGSERPVAPPSTRASRSKRSQGTPPWVANLIMLVLGIIIGFVGHWLITPSGSSGTLFDLAVSKTRHFRGNSNAPVTMIEISDFQ